uniref:Uncharacterized protein LOC105141881 isoform X1 n=1 Tax=Rhizophora mucronata TaxID=61149 RepID=A0A2P2MMR2_RHIMU
MQYCFQYMNRLFPHQAFFINQASFDFIPELSFSLYIKFFNSAACISTYTSFSTREKRHIKR